MMKRIFISILALLPAFSLLVGVADHQRVSAANAADWRAGKIIDDFIFTDKSSMTVSQVQEFLNQKVGTGGYGRVAGQCDTNGMGTSEYGGGTRAQYGAAHSNPAPFTCLKDYWEVPKQDPGPGTPASNYGGAPIPAGAKSAANIIWDAAQRYNISPKILLVTIQKESRGPLTTDDWPFRSQYTYAMGARCPDTAPCDPNYAGFSMQIHESARLFRYYLDNMGQSWWPYKKPGNNSILYNPNAGCGSSNVYIESKATAALYTYTPYQPNQAALNNLYGSGDSCSAYGNRNFWRIYTDWFGNPTRFNGGVTIKTGVTLSKPTYHVGDTATASYVIENLSDVSVNVGVVGICARMNGMNYDFGTTPITLGARGTYTVSFSRTINHNGLMSVFACSYNEALGGWASHFYPYANDTIARQRDAFVFNNPLVTSSLALSPSNPTINQPVTASFTMHNSSSNAVTVPVIGVAARDPSGTNVGYPGDTNVTIPANSDYTYSKTRTFTGSPGSYRFFITSFRNNTWDDNYPASSSGIARNLNATIYDNPLITSNLTITPASPTINQPVTASFSVRNNGSTPVTLSATGVAVRDSAGTNVGYPGDTNVTIPANNTYTYTKTKIFTGSPGNYRFFVTSLRNNNWDDNYPANAPGLSRSLNLMVYDNPLVTSGITLSPATPSLNQPVTASFTITNNSSSPVVIPVVGIAVRDPSGRNVGYPGDTNVTIPANDTYTYSKTRTFSSPGGNYRFFVTSFRNNTWDDNYPVSGPGVFRNILKQIN